jgi:hypothetical protein
MLLGEPEIHEGLALVCGLNAVERRVSKGAMMDRAAVSPS